MNASLASIIAVSLLGVVAFVWWRNPVLRRPVGGLRGEMAEVRRNRLALGVALSNASAGAPRSRTQASGGSR